MAGKLYIVATPIGNLGDMTFRAVETLKAVDIVAAEDTRHSIKLLNHFEISKKMISYHKFSNDAALDKVINALLDGKDIALISDAGTPCISDPGAFLVKTAKEQGIDVITIPGACAAISALSISGLDSSSFVFEGFLPKKPRDMKHKLDLLSHETRTIILYESPHRIKETLGILPKYFKSRNVCIASELTKINEKANVYSIDELDEILAGFNPRGEYVLIIDAAAKEDANWENISIEEHIKSYINDGYSKMDAVKMVAKDRKISKSEIYKYSLDI